MASMLACLGFLTTWWPGSKRREAEVARPSQHLSSEIPEHHFRHVLLVETVIGPAQVPGYRRYAPPSPGGMTGTCRIMGGHI